MHTVVVPIMLTLFSSGCTTDRDNELCSDYDLEFFQEVFNNNKYYYYQ